MVYMLQLIMVSLGVYGMAGCALSEINKDPLTVECVAKCDDDGCEAYFIGTDTVNRMERKVDVYGDIMTPTSK